MEKLTDTLVENRQGMRAEHSRSIPELRFPEFEGEWMKSNFGDKATNKSKKYNPETNSENFKCIELEHLATGTGELLGYTNSKEAGSIKNRFEKGDVLFGKLRPYLRKYLLSPFQGVCSSEIWVIRGLGVSNNFLYWMIQTNKFIGLANQSSGSKMPRADWDVLSSSVFSFPTLPEQQKIANFFTAIDQKISQLKRKKTLLEQYKKGVMQKIFSQQIRFKDDDGKEFPDWDKKRLGEFLIKHEEKTTENNQYPVLTSARTGIYFQKDYFDGNDVASKDNTGYNVVPRNYFTYRHMSDDLIFRFNINTICDKGIVSTLYPVFTTKKINDFFLQEILKEGEEFRRYALEQKQGGSRTYMYFNKLTELILLLPSLPEQTKIANFLSAIDDKIQHTHKQVKQAEQWKNGLMQKMFV